ncbi:Crp/Fnr family transcriptional regulator [Leptolyngbya sp. NK1-12]|uniref:Crp/Fnr family transcriptional regulator n=1 Tax=Leptolyngbya sp. NK1-12 TaxID=2547451 RepID=A0AA96WE54_9CYAN|nr:Crp/Fnr family transcriptional regulator [Leptolyngbya sp. NK1-12]WNZ23488.1 Crp/Fnr family transcriptional regulator [Leptolyngbya sp. NK1-12]
MQASIAQLRQISVLRDLEEAELEQLQAATALYAYQTGEVVMHAGDPLPSRLYVVFSGVLQITRVAQTGKETVFRVLPAGEIFAAPALVGDGIAPATVMATGPAEVLTIERDALLQAISRRPEVALRILEIYNQRLQQLHNMVHDLVSERALVRLIHLIRYYAMQFGTTPSNQAEQLNVKLSYYQLARSVGITYEECVRLFKLLQPVVSYKRGGLIQVTNWQALAAMATRAESAKSQSEQSWTR